MTVLLLNFTSCQMSHFWCVDRLNQKARVLG